MKAVRIHEFGGPEVLRYEDVPDPKPRKDQVLVRVRACALNHLDIWVRKGLPGVSLPHTLGSDIAGEIVEVGEYVSGFKPGQRVLLAPMHFCNHCAKCVAGLQNQCPEFTVLGNRVDGGNCELIAVPTVNVIPIPDSLDFNQAASVPLVFVTAWRMLVGLAGVRQGQTVLVLGASSGVGTAAIQIAKLFNTIVITTAGDDRKLAKGRELGADHLINHYKQKISDEVKRIIRALQLGKRAMLKSRDKTLDLITHVLKMDKETAVDTYKVVQDSFNDTGIPTREGIGNIIKAIKYDGRFADRNIAYEEVAEPRFAIEVAKELGYKVP